MSRVETYYDKIALNFPLNRAIALTVIFPSFAFIGFDQLLTYFRSDRSWLLFLGPLNLIAGIVGVFYGVHMIHAVVRRLVAEAEQRPRPSPR
jgi:hypothetical protein